ncbi:MAG TPA: class I SAM-dependent methyltransferase [Candidatus Binatia bacterium]|jgi:SAM-dependent methyltransferase
MTATDAAAATVPCPLCGDPGQRRTRYALSAFDVVECPRCGGLQRDPLPGPAEMAGYYSDPRYIDGSYFDVDDGGVEARIFSETLGALATRRTSLQLAPTGRLLDVGAGSGAFLRMAMHRSWDAQGVELSPELAARAAATSAAVVVCGDFETAALPSSSYDAITMWDVLEHTIDPGRVLDRARALLADRGVLVVLTIDAASLFNVVADLAWRASAHLVKSPLELLYDKRHNHYFTGASLSVLLGRHGFRVEQSRSHRAHLGRWLSEPAPAAVVAGGAILDALSVPLRRCYRQLLFCVGA